MQDNQTTKKYQQQKYRFVILAVYILTALVNSIPVHTFSSISGNVARVFDLDQVLVTLNAQLFTIAHPLFAFPCNWLLNKYGMRISFVVGGLFVIGGVWLRILIDLNSPYFCLAGSFLAAIGNIFILNSPSKVAINWFSAERVPIIVFVGILANLLSMTFGASIPGFFIKKQNSIQVIQRFLMLEAIIVTVPYIFLFIFFRETPSNAPSRAAKKVAKQKIRYRELIKELLKNKNYLILMLSMTLNYGTLTALLGVLNQLLLGLGYTEQQASNTFSTSILAAMLIGIISNILFSVVLKSTKAYKLLLSLSNFGGFMMCSFLIAAFCQHLTKVSYLIVLGGLVGFFFIPVPSLIVSFSSQVVFPIDQASSAGYLFASSQTFGFLLGFGTSLILQNNKNYQTSQLLLIIYGILSFLSFFSSLFVKQNLKKYEHQLQVSLIQPNLKQSLVITQ